MGNQEKRLAGCERRQSRRTVNSGTALATQNDSTSQTHKLGGHSGLDTKYQTHKQVSGEREGRKEYKSNQREQQTEQNDT